MIVNDICIRALLQMCYNKNNIYNTKRSEREGEKEKERKELNR